MRNLHPCDDMTMNIIGNQITGEQTGVKRNEMADIFNSVNDAITIHDNDFNIIHSNMAAVEALGIKQSRDLGQKCYQVYHGSDQPPDLCPSCRVLQTGIHETSEMFEPHLNKYIEIRAFPRFDKRKRVIGIIHIVRDISVRKKMEEHLKRQTDDLQESNNAFNFLLKQRERDRRDFEERIISNMKVTVFPTIRRLKKNLESSEAGRDLNILESKLKDIISPFSMTLSSRHANLSAREVEISHFIRDGLQDKDIAEELNLSYDTIRTHRQNLRKKLQITGKKINLKTYLMSLPYEVV